ncbi:MAG: NAD-dependent epimerase/dehydratase family protein [Christensenellaceae bacterium]
MNRQNKTVVISGASAMIGSCLVDYASSLGDRVVCIVRKGSPNAECLTKNDKVSIIELDLSDYNKYTPEIKADVFFHLAWDKTSVSGRDDVFCQLNNVRYALDAVLLAKRFGCKVFVGAGSQAEYGVKDCALTPGLAVNPESGYGIAKFSAGRLSALLAKQEGIRHVWARILSVYGTRQSKTSLVGYLVECFKNGVEPKLTKCEQDWDYIYETDCAKALYMLGESGVDQKAYPIGSGQPRKLKDYVLAIKEAAASELEIGFGEKQYYPHQPMTLVADVSELTKDTGFVPEVGFEEGIRKILE